MYVIPLFPNFKKIELDDKNAIEEFTKQFSPYNDFEFASLWTYNIGDRNSVSQLNNNLAVKIQDFVTGNFFYSFLGNNNSRDTIEQLLKKSKENRCGTKLYLIPAINLHLTTGLEKHFLIKEDLDSFDYILSVDEVANLKGKKYYDKRNLVNRFVKKYPQHTVEILDLASKKTKQEIMELFSLWATQKRRTKNETKIELTAIKRLFDLVDMLRIIGMGVYFQNRLIGFCTYHAVQYNYAIMSFEKGDISYKGIYEYLNHQAAKHLKTLGVQYINYEQDLGIPGLKKAKMLWRPVHFLKKYTIEEKP